MVTFFLSFLFSACLFPLFLHSSITITVEQTKMEQKSATDPMLPTVIKGRPFTLKISFDGSLANTGIDLSEITKNFTIHSSSRSTNIQMINNTVQSTATQQYEISAKKTGTFEIGPFTIQNVTSNSIILVAREKTDADQQALSNDPDDDDTYNYEDVSAEMHVQLIPEKTKAYVQEPLLIKRLLLQKGPIRRTQLEPLSCTGATIKKLPNELQRVEIINNSNYRITEERYLLFANKEGPLSIPGQRFIFDYTPSSHRRTQGNDPFRSLLQQFMHFSLQQAEGRSNDLSIESIPLPENIKRIDAVGSFSEYLLEIDKNEVGVHQPLKISITLTGIGNFDEIPSPELKIPHLDTPIFATEQKMKTEIDLYQKPGTKVFSFIFQPETPGELVIPEQSFTYFDPKQHKNITLKTSKLSCLIKPSQQKTSLQEETSKENKTKMSNKEKQEDQEQKSTLNHYRESTLPSALPWSLFFLLLLLPFFLLYQQLSYFFLRKRNSSQKELFSQLHQAFADKKYTTCNELIRKIIANKTGLSPMQITETLIENLLLEQNCLESEIILIKKMYLQTITKNTNEELTPEMIQKGITLMKKFFIFACFMLLSLQNISAAVQADKLTEKTTFSLDHLMQNIQTSFANQEYAQVLALSITAQKKLALSEISTHLELIKTLSKTRNLLKQKQSIPRSFLKKMDDLSRPLPLLFFQLLFLLFWTLGIYAIFHKKSTKNHKFAALFLLAFKSITLYHSYQIHQIPLGIVQNKTGIIFSGPSNTYQKMGTLTYGQECSLLQETEQFYKIKSDQGITGWAEKKDFLIA